MPVVAEEAIVKSRRLVISIIQTTDEDGDLAYLHKLVNVLKEFSGRDEVNLYITGEDKVVNLRLPNIYTNYCSELHQRLVDLVGEDGVRLETC